MDFKKLVMEIHNEYVNEQAAKRGMTVDAYLAQSEMEHQKVHEPIVNNEENVLENVLENIFSQSVDEYIRPTKSNITEIVKWTSSKFNDYRKKEVVDRVYNAAHNPSEGYLELFRCGAYSDASHSKKAANYGFAQYLAVKNGKVRWVYALGSEQQRIYEFN